MSALTGALSPEQGCSDYGYLIAKYKHALCLTNKAIQMLPHMHNQNGPL